MPIIDDIALDEFVLKAFEDIRIIGLEAIRLECFTFVNLARIVLAIVARTRLNADDGKEANPYSYAHFSEPCAC